MEDDRDVFKANGWEQFSILRPTDHKSTREHSHIPVNDGDLLLVVTQTCDLINNVHKEPFFEAICLHLLNKSLSVEHEHARNSRRFELRVDIEGRNNNYYLLAHEKFSIRHEILKEIKPVDNITNGDTKLELIKWLTSRYGRAAFPDSFNNRLKKGLKQVEKIIKELKLVQDIYIKLNPLNEIDDAQDYDLEILLLMDAGRNSANTFPK